MKIKVLAALLLIAAVVIGADRFGLFGESQLDMRDLIHLNVRPVDKNTGQVVTDVHITCVRRKSDDACTQQAPSGDGIVTLNFLLNKSVKLSRLFKFQLKEKLWVDEEQSITLVFIQPNYDRYFLVLSTPDLLQWADKVKDVPMSLSTDTGSSANNP